MGGHKPQQMGHGYPPQGYQQPYPQQGYGMPQGYQQPYPPQYGAGVCVWVWRLCGWMCVCCAAYNMVQVCVCMGVAFVVMHVCTVLYTQYHVVMVMVAMLLVWG